MQPVDWSKCVFCEKYRDKGNTNLSQILTYTAEHNAGINLTGYHPPPGHPGAFAPKCVPSPRAFAQQKMPGDRANK